MIFDILHNADESAIYISPLPALSSVNYIMQMDQQWIYDDWRTDEFITGLRSFIGVAEANDHNGFMCCPYVVCQNKKDYSFSKILHTHLLRYGFMPSYNCWTKHGETGVMMEENEEEEDGDNYPMFPEYGDTATGEAEDQEADRKSVV